MAKGKIEYDVCKVAIDQIRDTDTKTIEVDNCQDCPFILNDEEYGYVGCNIGKTEDFNLEQWEELPKDKVHDKCPLRLSNYKIKLK